MHAVADALGQHFAAVPVDYSAILTNVYHI